MYPNPTLFNVSSFLFTPGIFSKIYKLKFLFTYSIFDKILISQKASNCEINLKNFTKSQYLFLNPAIF